MKTILISLTICLLGVNLYSQNLLGYKSFNNAIIKHEKNKSTIGSSTKTEVPNIGLTGNLLTSFNGTGITPNLLFKGSYKDTCRSEFYDLELCFIKNQNDSIRIDNATKLFIPELSNYAINFWYTKILNEKWAINGLASYGTKGLTSIDTTSGINYRNTGIFSFKGGFEGRLAPDFLSFYGNVNYLIVASDKNNYNEFFGNNIESNFIFFDFGLKFKITDGPFDGIFVNFSSILKTDKMKTICNNNDPIIPVLKIGLERYLHFNE